MRWRRSRCRRSRSRSTSCGSLRVGTSEPSAPRSRRKNPPPVDAILEAESLAILDRAPEHPTRVALVRLPSGVVAQQISRRCARRPMAGAGRSTGPAPGTCRTRPCERRIHRGPVEPGPMLDRLAELRGGDRDRLHPTDHVGELEIDVAYLRFLNPGEEVRGRFPSGGRCQVRASNWAERTSADGSADTNAPSGLIRRLEHAKPSARAQRSRLRVGFDGTGCPPPHARSGRFCDGDAHATERGQRRAANALRGHRPLHPVEHVDERSRCW